MTPELLAGIAGSMLSVIFEYVPGISRKFAELNEAQKRVLMIFLLALASLGAYAASCTGAATYVSCDEAGVANLAGAFVLAIATNQTTHQIAKKPVSHAIEPA